MGETQRRPHQCRQMRLDRFKFGDQRKLDFSQGVKMHFAVRFSVKLEDIWQCSANLQRLQTFLKKIREIQKQFHQNWIEKKGKLPSPHRTRYIVISSLSEFALSSAKESWFFQISLSARRAKKKNLRKIARF